MSKLVIVIEISGRQSEDKQEAVWAVKNIVDHVGGYNEAFTVNIPDDEYAKLASDESATEI